MELQTHVYDLAAGSHGGDPGRRSDRGGTGLRAARLQAIPADIAANLRDCGLSVAAVAARQGVTPRYIHRLFEGEDITFAELKAVGDERKGPNDD